MQSSSAGGRNSPSNRSQRPSTRSPQIAMNCDVLPKRSASSMRLTTCVEVSLPVTPARCADRWLPRLQRRATSRMCRSICSPPSCGKWRIRRIAPRDDLKEAEGQAKQIDHQLEELGQRLDGAADLEAIEEAIITVGRLVQSKGAAERAVAEARLTVDQARLAVADLNERSSGLLDGLLAVRDRIAVEKPPLPGNGAIDAWRQFVIWLAEKTAARSRNWPSSTRPSTWRPKPRCTAEEGLRSWLEQFGIASIEVA